MRIPHSMVAALALTCFLQLDCFVVASQRRVKQSPDAVKAYHVCRQFERLIGENLDFNRAYEATFTKNAARRRAIAIADGEFGDLDFAGIDDATLINAYKNEMQMFYLILPLASPGRDEDAALFFPPPIKQLIRRKPASNTEEFRQFAAELDRSVLLLRTHLEQLAVKYPSVAERIRVFKAEAMASKFDLPTTYKVKPQRGSYKYGVLGNDEDYYRVGGYTVIREGGQMKIVGINFFNRLF